MKILLPAWLASVACLCLGTAHAQLVRQASTTLTLPADLPIATGYTTQNALGTLTFSAPIDVASAPGVANRLFVVERNTGLQIVNLDTLTKSTFLDLATYLTSQGTPVNTGSESGILSTAFHPNYNQNGYFYIFFSLNISGQLHQRVARFRATGTAGNYNAATTALGSTQQPLITQRDTAGNHNGGDMAFGADGYLYISVGDEGPQYDGGDNARRIAKDFFGAILRIDVDQNPANLIPNPHDESSTATVGDSAWHPGTYRVPANNPFTALPVDGSGNSTYNGFTFPNNRVRTEIYSIGYRNPWRMSFDPPTGRLFVADVGQDTYEEVSIVSNGTNGGWSWREGLHPHTPATAPSTPPVGFTSNPPFFEYDHTNDGGGSGNDAIIYGTSITGGVVYRGDRLPELLGDYLLADYNTGFIVAVRQNPNLTWTARRLGTDANISGFGTDPRNNDALLCDLTAGIVKRLARSGTAGTNPPALLSATGAFSNLATLTPNAGIVDYEPNVAFWSDYATKSRWFAIKNLTDTVGFSANGNWTLPTGMVWIKHFDIETTRGNPATRRKLETRFLVKTATDIYGLSYKWRDDQSEADLVAEDGLSEPIPSSSPAQTWRYPSRTECRVCHTNVAGFALSFNTRQLNRTHPYGALTPNQISALNSAGYFITPPANVNTLPFFAAAGDTTKSLEFRVRSYLAVNCVQCHQPGGAATGNWDARPTTQTDAANLINGLLVNNGGDAANRFAVPNDAAHSMVLKRLQGAGVPRMPPLATNELDPVAIQLLTDWITLELPTRESLSQWQTRVFGTPAPLTGDADFDGQTNGFEFLTGTDPLDANGRWPFSAQIVGENYEVTFPQTENRAVLIETSLNLQTWSLWDVPGNRPTYNFEGAMRTIVAPVTEPSRYFRARITEQ
ncbi:MAG: PQQ-dependent sugar dehydrogenase [Chthoniobacteraceae bacterium]